MKNGNSTRNKPANVPALTNGGRHTPPAPPHDRLSGTRPRKRIRCLADLDGRTKASITARKLVARLERDLGGDLSTAQQELVKRAVVLSVILESHEVDWLETNNADLHTYGRLVDRQRRVLETLGLVRQPRDITPPEIDIKAMIKQAKAGGRTSYAV